MNCQKNNSTYGSEPTISYENAIEAAVKSHKEAFPFSSCSEKCLKAQLESDRDKQCGPDTNPTLKYVPIGKKEQDEE